MFGWCVWWTKCCVLCTEGWVLCPSLASRNSFKIWYPKINGKKSKMAARLSHVASRIMGSNGIVMRSAASSLFQHSGMGLPIGKHIVPNKPLPVNDELVWDNGTLFPEPCIDRIADTVGKYEALALLYLIFCLQ